MLHSVTFQGTFSKTAQFDLSAARQIAIVPRSFCFISGCLMRYSSTGSEIFGKRLQFFTASLVVCLLFSGCHLRPDWGPPGTIGAQRARANTHDPFPDNDLGPPIMGGRPLGFDRPRSEATHLQDSPYARRSMNGGYATPYQGF